MPSEVVVTVVMADDDGCGDAGLTTPPMLRRLMLPSSSWT